ncbi:acetylglutamate kinase [Gimesia maris]|uniref:Acetylglutamate kinase n=1 Tax=Gimesia maris TaxID=122 RepID=A0ABX5YQK9_9PLAN|nr:acetylglutamate kinase [Gimesia maris]EDL59630.1 acetylglutamate kinase [Gimesia maris DSM 8797]QDT80336.1 Acetylglutamate kinase [Gimesia maris]QEG18010.1 Acetylglutamate kinase [Gimesia maris]QGQ28969.1 acetylglutamate kinase [Gimesia maris]
MEGAVRKAAVLIEALSWIRRFRGRYVVIKLGGSALEEEAAVKSFLTDVIFMRTVGMHPILVHGGGKAISQAMNSAGIEPRFVNGRRFTDEQTLEIATDVLANQISASLVQEIQSQGAKAEALHFGTRNCLRGEQLTLQAEDGSAVDLGHVGFVTDVDQDLLAEICQSDAIPVIPSVALDASGQKLNVNADTAAAALARILKAEKLVFLSDVPGIFLDRHDPETLVSHLETQRCRALIADGTIDAGMVPKVDAALEALASGVGKVHIVDARLPHSILLEIYSDKGIGTEIVK